MKHTLTICHLFAVKVMIDQEDNEKYIAGLYPRIPEFRKRCSQSPYTHTYTHTHTHTHRAHTHTHTHTHTQSTHAHTHFRA